jgi:hypothetical protein
MAVVVVDSHRRLLRGAPGLDDPPDVQLLVDAAVLVPALQWLVRIGIPVVGGILMSAGFFTSMYPPTTQAPRPTVNLVYVGAMLLAVSVVTLGVGRRKPRRDAPAG